MWRMQCGKSRNGGHHERGLLEDSHEIWRNQTNPWMKGITSGCREEAVSISGVATIPLPGRSKTSPGLPQVRPAGRGHARFCNLLIIKYHFYSSVETMAFFWLRFHATFYNSLTINTSKNRAWPRPATPRSIATHIRNTYASPGSI